MRQINENHIKNTLNFASEKNIWAFSPGKNGSYWPTCIKSQVAALGWDDIGDLRNYHSSKKIEQAMLDAKPVNQRSERPTIDASSLWDFYKHARKGDIIIAKKGRSKKIYGIGVIISDYVFKNDKTDYKHEKLVDWVIQKDMDFPELRHNFATKAFYQYTHYHELRYFLLNFDPSLKSNLDRIENDKIPSTSSSLESTLKTKDKYWTELPHLTEKKNREESESAFGEVLSSSQGSHMDNTDWYADRREVKPGILRILKDNLDTIITLSCFFVGLIVFLFFSIMTLIELNYIHSFNFIFINLGPYNYNLNTVIFNVIQGVLGLVIMIIALKPQILNSFNTKISNKQ